MWLVAVVGRCVVGCEHCEGKVTFTVLTLHRRQCVSRFIAVHFSHTLIYVISMTNKIKGQQFLIRH